MKPFNLVHDFQSGVWIRVHVPGWRKATQFILLILHSCRVWIIHPSPLTLLFYFIDCHWQLSEDLVLFPIFCSSLYFFFFPLHCSYSLCAFSDYRISLCSYFFFHDVALLSCHDILLKLTSFSYLCNPH